MGQQFKLLFMIIIYCATVNVYGCTVKKRGDNYVLKVAFPYDKPASFYEPTKIFLSPEYAFLENIYSTLIRLDPKTGEPIPNLAKSFSWKGDSLEIVLKENLKTSQGSKIGAKDVVNSLKRLVILSQNTHGKFKSIVCPNTDIKSILDKCENLLSNQSDNKITIKTSSRNDFLIPMLAAIDFAIIPTASLNPENLEIADYSNTTGPYYVSKDDQNGNIQLKVNRNHHLYSDRIPKVVEFVPSGFKNYRNSFELYKNGEVDFITTIDKNSELDVFKFSEENSCSKHTTLNLRTYTLTFTSKGIRELSLNQRKAIGAEFKRAYIKFFKDYPIYENTNQFFPAFGEGWLKKSELKDLDNLLDFREKFPEQNIKITSVRTPKAKEIFDNFIRRENVVFTEAENIPLFSGQDNEVHAFIGGPDAGYMEDISLISYSIAAGNFGPDKDFLDKWLLEYMNNPHKDSRIKKLKEMHLNILSKYYTIPLVSAPYVSCVRDNWKLNFSQFYANDPIWQITKK